MSSVCKKFMLVISQPCWPTSPMSMTGLQGHEVVMRDFSSTRVCLVHQSVEFTDSVSVRWRVVQGKVCICSFYAPHPGFSEGDRISCWRDLLASARHVHSTMNLPMIMGDANVWHPHFNLGRTRSVDALITPFADLLASSCGLMQPT